MSPSTRSDDPSAHVPAVDAEADTSVVPGVKRLLRLDFAPSDPQPSAARVAMATGAGAAGSLLACAGLVAVAKALFPSTAHFSHFALWDYGSLTVIGVLIAGAGWPVVTRVTSTARWLFLRLAVAVTLALWLPDVWLLARGESTQGVATLMVMHFVIAVVTYNSLVRIAAVPAEPASDGTASRVRMEPRAPRQLSPRSVRRIWNVMALLVGTELVLGVVTIVLIPDSRYGGVVPSHNGWVFVLHGGIGAALGAGAVGVLVLSAAADRLARIGAVLGALGTGLGLVGGTLAAVHSSHLLGAGLMLVGVVIAGIGYLVPAMEEMGRREQERAGLSELGGPPGS